MKENSSSSIGLDNCSIWLTPDVLTSCSSLPQGGMKLILRDTPVNSWKRTCALPPQSPMESGYAEVGVRLVPPPPPSLCKVVIQQSGSSYPPSRLKHASSGVSLMHNASFMTSSMVLLARWMTFVSFQRIQCSSLHKCSATADLWWVVCCLGGQGAHPRHPSWGCSMCHPHTTSKAGA